MRLLLLGATGEIGRHVTARVQREFLDAQVTILVRDKEKLQGLLEGNTGFRVIEGDILDRNTLADAFRGQEACICTAGNASKNAEEFRQIFAGVIYAASEMVGQKRLWMMAGITVMDLPHSSKTTKLNDLPIFKHLPFRVHSGNYERLTTAGDDLDWSLMCPGKLTRSKSSSSSQKPVTHTEEAPIWLPRVLSRCRPLWVLAAVISLAQLGKFSVTLDDVARVMVDDLSRGGTSLSRVRVTVTKG